MGLFVPTLWKHLGLDDWTAKAPPNVTAHATEHTLGSWASLIDPVSFNAYAIAIGITGVGAANTDNAGLVDIGIGPTGGGNEQVILPQLTSGAAVAASSNGAPGKFWIFPVLIPAGLRISARAQSVVSGDVCQVKAMLFEHPFGDYLASKWWAYGASTSTSSGTSVTTGSGSFGSWTQIGASNVTEVAHSLWQCGYDYLTDPSVSAGVHRVEIGYGPDSSSVTRIGVFEWYTPDTAEQLMGPFPNIPIHCPVPAGSTLWARVNGTSAEARGVIIYAA